MKRIANALCKLNWGKMASVLTLCATGAALSAQTLTTLHTFANTDGAAPFAALVQATNGSLYGTTSGGGAAGFGTVFRITTGGTLTTLYSFCSQSGCTDGESPRAGLIQATNGDLYGTTSGGGTSGSCPVTYIGPGCGTLFKITLGGKLTTLYSFCSQSGCADGAVPDAALVQAANGDLYGTTFAGGANSSAACPSYAGPGCGTVFRITLNGTLTTLYSFCSQTNCSDGFSPLAELAQAANGDLYGTTSGGGANGLYDGTVFKITPTGTLTTLYSFCSPDVNCTDGVQPYAGLTPAANGDFYGTTSSGGINADRPNAFGGTVFKISPSGALTTIYSFCSQYSQDSACTDGEQPSATLIQATDGNLYGTTPFGGTVGPGDGTVFKITPDGTLTTIYNFCSEAGCTDGDTPNGGLVQDTNGNLYGTTLRGPSGIYGTVFSISLGLGPFVETRPSSGEVGVRIDILGSDLTGATSVRFNGTAAAFTVVSRYLITATVPAGATSGRVQVVTPIGTLKSNRPFRVP